MSTTSGSAGSLGGGAHQPGVHGRGALVRGVIHDIGYRPYPGARHGEGSIAWWLYLAGLRNAFGLGRSAKSKIMPFALVTLNVVPALILVAVMVVTRATEPLIAYAAYPMTTMILSCVFAAAQAPVLFSRDLRHGSIVLYLARPLSSSTYALARWAALATALLLFLLAPIVVLAVGALLAEIDVTDTIVDASQAALLGVLLAAMLASVSGLASALSVRRGFAIVATIGVLLFGYGVVSAVQGISYEQDQEGVGVVAGLVNPFSLYSGLIGGLLDQNTTPTPPESGAATAAYLAVSLLVVLAGVGLLLLRYKKVAGR